MLDQELFKIRCGAWLVAVMHVQGVLWIVKKHGASGPLFSFALSATALAALGLFTLEMMLREQEPLKLKVWQNLSLISSVTAVAVDFLSLLLPEGLHCCW